MGTGKPARLDRANLKSRRARRVSARTHGRIAFNSNRCVFYHCPMLAGRRSWAAAPNVALVSPVTRDCTVCVRTRGMSFAELDFSCRLPGLGYAWPPMGLYTGAT